MSCLCINVYSERISSDATWEKLIKWKGMGDVTLVDTEGCLDCLYMVFISCVIVFKWHSNRLLTLYQCANVLFCFSWVRLEKTKSFFRWYDLFCCLRLWKGSPLLLKCNTTALYCSASFNAVLLTGFCCCKHHTLLQACSSSFTFVLFLNSPMNTVYCVFNCYDFSCIFS